MSKNFRIALAIGAVVVGGLATAKAIEPLVVWFKSGLYVGSTSVRSSSTNRVSAIRQAVGSYDFPVLDAGCAVSSAITVTGAAFGDVCVVSQAELVPDQDSTLSCFVSASGAVKVRACSPVAAVDPADAGLHVVVISNQ